MLVRRRMKHDAGVVFLEHIAQTRHIADAADFDVDFDVAVLGQQFVAQHVDIVFIHIEEHDARRSDRAQLAAELGADGTAAAGDQHRFAGDIPRYRTRVEDHFVSPEQVGHVDVAQGHIIEFVDAQFTDVGQRAQLAVGLRADVVDALALIERRRRDGHDDLLDIEGVDQVENILAAAVDLHAMDAQTAFGWIIIRGHDGHAGHQRIFVDHAVDDERPGFTGTHHQRARTIRGAFGDETPRRFERMTR